MFDLGSIVGTLGSAFLNQSIGQRNTEFNKEQNLDYERKAPSAQVQGLRDAGLNPMLAYGKLDFGGVAPGPMGSSNFNTDMAALQQSGASGVSSAASTQQAEASTLQATTSARAQRANERLIDNSVDKIKQEITNLQTDNQRVNEVIRLLGQQVTNAMHEGNNLVEVGNQLRATVDKLRAEVPLIRSQQFLAEGRKVLADAQTALTHSQTALTDVDVRAATAFEEVGKTAGALKPFFEVLLRLFRR